MVTQPMVQSERGCPRCGTVNAPGAVFCATCGLRLTASAPGGGDGFDQPVVAAGAPAATPSPVGSAIDWIKRGGDTRADDTTALRRYPGLQALAGVMKIVAVIVGIWGVLAFVGDVNAEHLQWDFSPLDPFGAAMIFQLGAPIVAALLLWAIGSLIVVLIDIEAGLRRPR